MYFEKLTPSTLELELNAIENHCKCLRAEIEKARANHKALPKGNDTYDEIAYHTFQIAIHNDMIRAGLEKTTQHAPTILANGTALKW
jgi:hypothetical protein